MNKSVKQLAAYMDRTNTSEGWLVVFDRRKEKSWDEKIGWETQVVEGKRIHLVWC